MTLNAVMANGKHNIIGDIQSPANVKLIKESSHVNVTRFRCSSIYLPGAIFVTQRYGENMLHNNNNVEYVLIIDCKIDEQIVKTAANRFDSGAGCAHRSPMMSEDLPAQCDAMRCEARQFVCALNI